MIIVTDWLYSDVSLLLVSMPSFGFFMSFRRNCARVVGHTNFAALPLETGIPTPCSNCTFGEPSEVDTFQFNHLLREWPYDDSRNFLIRAGGDQNCFYNWLQVRSRIGRND